MISYSKQTTFLPGIITYSNKCVREINNGLLFVSELLLSFFLSQSNYSLSVNEVESKFEGEQREIVQPTEEGKVESLGAAIRKH